LDKQWKQIFGIFIGFLLLTIFIQAVTDVMIFGKPFVQIEKYIAYNKDNAETFGVSPWYKYILFFSGILIPPMSLLVLGGFFIGFRKRWILFLPTLLFIVFHSYFPNKQERFIVPALPFLIIAGIVGWNEWITSSKNLFPAKFKRIAWIVFICLNTIPLFVISITYSKKSMCEAMYYLYHQKNAGAFVLEQSTKESNLFMPVYYAGKWNKQYNMNTTTPAESVYFIAKNTNEWPTHVLFFEDDHLPTRIANFKKYFPHIKYETTIEPSFTDKLMHTLNPINANYKATIYSIDYSIK
jgi:hypothetical protein